MFKAKEAPSGSICRHNPRIPPFAGNLVYEGIVRQAMSGANRHFLVSSIRL